MIRIPYGRWHEFIPNIRSEPTPSTYDNLPAMKDLGHRPFLGMLFSKDSFYAGVFHSPKLPWVWILQKRGGAGYRNGRWAGGITAVFSEHPLSLKNSYHPAVTGSPWVDSTGCNRPMSDVHPSASALKLAPLSVCLISVVLCLGVGKHQTPEDSVHKEQAKSHERSWDDKISKPKKRSYCKLQRFVSRPSQK